MSDTTYTVFHGGTLHGTGSYSGPGLDILQALRDAAECSRTVGGEPVIVSDDMGRHVRLVDGIGWVEMPEQYDPSEITETDCREDCQVRIVAYDGEESEAEDEAAPKSNLDLSYGGCSGDTAGDTWWECPVCGDYSWVPEEQSAPECSCGAGMAQGEETVEVDTCDSCGRPVCPICHACESCGPTCDHDEAPWRDGDEE